MTTRRAFLGLAGASTAGVALALTQPVAAVVVSARGRHPLPPVHAGDVLTAAAWNALVVRVNELSQ